MSTRRLNFSLPSLPKAGLYISLLLLPGGLIGLLLMWWLGHRARNKPKGNARMWYPNMYRWRDVPAEMWQLVIGVPRLNLDIGVGAPARRGLNPAAQYVSGASRDSRTTGCSASWQSSSARIPS